jgi:hypothetical protein
MHRFTMTAVALGLLSANCVPSLRASDTDKETRITITQPLQVQDTLLAPGQYLFRLTQPNSSLTVVSIYNADRTRLEGIIMGWSAYRVEADDQSLFSISQPNGNQPAQLQSWFFPGDNYGVEFATTGKGGEVARASKSGGKQQNAGSSSKQQNAGSSGKQETGGSSDDASSTRE